MFPQYSCSNFNADVVSKSLVQGIYIQNNTYYKRYTSHRTKVTGNVTDFEQTDGRTNRLTERPIIIYIRLLDPVA